jgi:hypothetical protein
MHAKPSHDNGLISLDSGTPGASRPDVVPGSGGTSGSISSSEEIPAKRTADSESPTVHPRPASAASFSALLRSFALGLCSERTRAGSGPMLPGLGGSSPMVYSPSDTKCSPSASEPVALASIIAGRGCSCLPRFPTPTASSHNMVKDVVKLVSRRERQKALGRNGNGFGLNLGQYCAIHGIPFTATLLESLMGFPHGWIDGTCEGTAMPSPPPSPSGSGEGAWPVTKEE